MLLLTTFNFLPSLMSLWWRSLKVCHCFPTVFIWNRWRVIKGMSNCFPLELVMVKVCHCFPLEFVMVTHHHFAFGYTSFGIGDGHWPSLYFWLHSLWWHSVFGDEIPFDRHQWGYGDVFSPVIIGIFSCSALQIWYAIKNYIYTTNNKWH